MTAYTDATKIAAHLGVTLTAGQIAQATIAADAITSWIDGETSRSWQTTSPATEILELQGDRVFLAGKPVVSITSVETRTLVIGATYVLVPAEQYELIDPAAGVLQIIGSGEVLVRVVYVFSPATPPADISFAATILAAELLATTLHPESSGVSQISVGQGDISLKFATASDTKPDVSRALEMIRNHRRWVIA